MDVRDLRIFLSVAEAGSMIRASERLFLSQSAISYHITKLEKGLGTRLLVRIPNGIQLTYEGIQLKEFASSIVNMFDNGLLLFTREPSQESRAAERQERIRVSLSTSLFKYVYPAVLPMLTSQLPGVRFVPIRADNRSALKTLERREAECALTFERGPESGEMRTTPIAPDSYLTLCGPDHPALCAASPSFSDLAPHPLFLVEDSYTFRYLTAALKEAGLEADIVPLRTIEEVLNAILRYEGYTFFSELAWYFLSRQLPHTAFRLTDFHPPRMVHLTYRTDCLQSSEPSLAGLSEVLSQTLCRAIGRIRGSMRWNANLYEKAI